jgi:N-acetylmuramoyl-L-alanine amidase
MPIYIVKPGDCLTHIAAALGLGDYKDIYEHPANAEYRKLRPNPHVIQPGDKLFVPETIPFTRTLATGQKHRIPIKLPRATLQVYVKDADGDPLAGRNYLLCVEGQADKPGTSGGDGLVKEEVPVAASVAHLDFPDDGFSFEVKLGHVDPLDERNALAARLRNLGFACPESEDLQEMGRRVQYALARLQAENALEPTGELDDPTRDLLLQLHDQGEAS